MKSYEDIRKCITDHLGSDVLDSVLVFVAQCKPSLWGERKGVAFVSKCTCLAIYKDLTGDGYGKIISQINFLEGLNPRSFNENTRRIRDCLGQWGRTQVVLGDSKDWEADKRLMEDNPDLKKVNLWIDSTDFAKKKYRHCSKKSPDHSFKLNRPGLRFTMLESGSRRIRKIWGGYSPKMHDGEFLQLKKHYMEKRLIDAVIIGDGHYTKGNKIFKRLKFQTPIKKPGAGRPAKDKTKETPKKKLSPAQRKYNNEQKHLRAHVESPFGWIKSTFSALNKPWQEDDDQLTGRTFSIDP